MSEFNNNISNWDVSNVTDMEGMFSNSVFNNNISKWKINFDCYTESMFENCPIRDEYKPKCLQLNEAFSFDSVNK